MKGFIFGLMLFATAAGASTVTPLYSPAAVVDGGICLGTGFAADDSVVGTCRHVHSLPCSGHSCTPVRYLTFYISHWDAAGNPTTAETCYMVRTHKPNADVYTYYNGHTPADCPFVIGTSTTVVVNGTPYYYVTTAADGSAELVNSNIQGQLVTP